MDGAGNAVWTHVCPKTTDERIEELTALVKDLASKQELVSETQREILDANQNLARRTIRSAEDAASALRAASIVKEARAR